MINVDTLFDLTGRTAMRELDCLSHIQAPSRRPPCSCGALRWRK